MAIEFGMQPSIEYSKYKLNSKVSSAEVLQQMSAAKRFQIYYKF